MNDNIFRSYDIRGIYPTEIDENIAYKIGLGYGSILQSKYNQTSCVVSHDNRISSPSLTNSLIKGLLETGINVIDYGLTTTPMNYYARHINNMYGIMVTASHNPSRENGFKFSFDEFANARGYMITEFRDYIKAGDFKKGTGTLVTKSIKNDYIKYLKDNISLGEKKLKVVFDPANGSVTEILSDVLKEFNIDYEIINGVSDGRFLSHHPDPSVNENLAQLKDAVIKKKANLGFSFDGDGDRLGIVDHLGNTISIEHYGMIIVKNIINNVDKKIFLYDAKSSDNFKDYVTSLNGDTVICRTGSSYTQEKIIKDGIPFGFQYVGHIGINDRGFCTESAIYAALRLIEILSNTDESLYDLVKDLPVYENITEMRIESTDDKKREVIENIKKYCVKNNYKIMEIDGLRVMFPTGWAYIRASNTGPTINFRAEAKNKKDLDNLVKTFTTLIDLLNK